MRKSKNPIVVFLLFITLTTTTYTTYAQCNTNTSICTPGLVGPFGFNTPGTPVSSCLDFFGPSVSYITLHITTGGPLEMLIDANANTGFIDVAIFNVPQGMDPCVAILNNANEIGCNYASNSSGCNQFGTAFGCPSSVPAPIVSAGDELMIVVENWSGASFNFNLQLGTGAQTGPPSATITPQAPVVTSDPPVVMTAANGGGTWSATCGACINPVTGEFDPSVAGVGAHDICYDIGVSPCDAQDCITMTVGVALGVEMSDVDLSCEDGNVTFEWETIQEMNCSHFVIEKSRDASNFEYVGKIDGHGTTNESISYTFQEPYDSENSYYRLSEVDMNGQVEVIGVYYTNCNRPDISVFPNPGKDNVTLSYSNFELNETDVSMYDNTGRLVLKEKANKNGESVLDIIDLSPQVYTIRIGDSENHKFVRFTKL